MFKFIHAADIHLDSPMARLRQYDDSPSELLRQATRRALTRIIDLALEEQVSFVLIAGDLYDGDWDDVATGMVLVKELSRLRQANIPVFLIAGNHDAVNKMTHQLPLPANVHFYGHRKPETRRIESLGVAIHGQSFGKQAVTENLAKGYPARDPECFNIGLLHTSLENADGEHARYAPCTVADLQAHGYDYWALGHIHTREIVCRDPCIVFPGNPQGRNVRETGERGVHLVSVVGRQVSEEFRPVDVVRWERVPLTAADARTPEDLLDQLRRQLNALRDKHEDRPLAVRVEIVGACAFHDRLLGQRATWDSHLRAVAQDIGSGEVWLEKIQFHTEPTHTLTDMQDAEGPLGEVASLIKSLQADDAQLLELASELTTMSTKLPKELREGPDALQFESTAWLREMLAGVEPLLRARLLGTAQPTEELDS